MEKLGLPTIIAVLTACAIGADAVEEDGAPIRRWSDGHPEVRAIFGHPFAAAGSEHRTKTFVRWPKSIHDSEIGAIQPTVVTAGDGEMFVDGYSRKSWELAAIGHSVDGGLTWQRLGSDLDLRFRTPKGFKQRGARTNGIGLTQNGSVLIHFGVQYNDGREPAGGYDDVSFHMHEYVARTADRGKTWDEAFKLNSHDLEQVGGQKCRFVQLPGGRMGLVLAVWTRATPEGNPIPMEQRHVRTYLYSSADDGRTWQRASEPICNHGWEPDLIVLASGRLLLAIRYQRIKLPHDPAGLVSPHHMRTDSPPYRKSKAYADGLVARFTAVLYSDDGGETWTQPRLVTGFDEQTGSLIQLSDGTVLLTFGCKTDTRGQRFMLSYDQGETWSRSVFQLHADGQYASSAVLADDTLVTVFHDTKGLRLHSLRWRAPSRDKVEAAGFFTPRVVEPLGVPLRRAAQ